MLRYHDEEWGSPHHDDAALFELLTLEGAQAGLSWNTILNKREGYRRAFAGFDIDRVAAFTDADAARLPRFAYDAAALGSELFGKITRRPVIFDREKVREMAQNAWVCSAETLRADLGWRPQVLVREGARLTYNWYKDNGWL
jgi:nucleoside-diphosphate-sugar epimerase